MSAVRKRLLFLSRDHGSVQAVLPLILALRAEAAMRVSVISAAVSRPLLDAHGIASEALDEARFVREPEACIADLLARHRPDLVVSGSSPAKAGPAPEAPEQFAILVARHAGVGTMAVLDCWGLYHERFGGSDISVDLSLLPDHLCVVDRRCRDELEALGVPRERMSITHNPWMDGTADASVLPEARRPIGGGWKVLFASQPLAETAGVRGWAVTQEELLTALVSALPPIDAPGQHHVRIRCHPAEHADRWSDLRPFQRKNVETVLMVGRGAETLSDVNLLVTRHSTLAYEALYYGIPCLSLRFDARNVPVLVTDEMQLSKPLFDADELRAFLATANPAAMKEELLAKKRRLMADELFFSDGQATGRVLRRIYKTLAI